MRPNLNPSPAPSRPHYIYQPNRAQTTASSYTYVPTHQVLSKPRPTFGPASSRTLTPSRRGLPPPPRDVFLAPQPNKSSTSLSAPSVNGSARSANYVPSKFPRPQSVGLYRRRNHLLLKSGGGRDVFAHDQARMPDVGDEDYDGVDVGKTQRPRLRWNRFKWCLFLANLVCTAYSLVALVFCLLVWFNIFPNADVVRVGNTSELVISTVAAALALMTVMLGWSGILLNNRAFLAIYTFLLWVVLAFIVAPGYLTFKRHGFDLEAKVNAQWSRSFHPESRLRIQNQLHCCGYFSPYVEATISQSCYSRSRLPGCKGKYLRFQKMILRRWYTASFGLVPLHISIMVLALLCSNHVTYRFGKGMMPKAYRLDMNSMAVLMDIYAEQLADSYSTESYGRATVEPPKRRRTRPQEGDSQATLAGDASRR